MRAALAAGALVLAGCAQTPPPAPPPPAQAPAAIAPPAAADADPPGVVRLHCDGGLQLRVHFDDDEARVAGLPGGEQRLLRDAGGVTPQQTVYSSAAWRVEFGLGPQGNEAQLQPLEPPGPALHCARARAAS